MRLKNKLLTVGCVALSAAAMLSGVACNDHEVAPFSKSLSAGKSQNIGTGSTRAVDILFVIDNSNSMTEEQQGLDKNFGEFLDRLNEANANYRLAAISTSYTGSQMSFVTNALDMGGASVIGTDLAESIKDECNAYFTIDSETQQKKTWIDYEDFAQFDVDTRKEKIKNLFRCEAIMGVNGDGIEKGLASMQSSLENARDLTASTANFEKLNFKRPGSILAIVFVTDENDCSSSTSLNSEECELKRNIEDSCLIAREDRIITDSESGSALSTSSGQTITILDGDTEVTKTLREWCVQGDDTARQALQDCANGEGYYASEDHICNAASYINCPNGSCSNSLSQRSDFYNFIINYVSTSNESYYRKLNADMFSSFTNAQEHKDTLETLAKSDVIVASIINRDQGIRYNEELPENWCGTAGSQSYRYQLFAEMFDNDPIYAPICCKNDRFIGVSSGVEKTVCSGQAVDAGSNGDFGPVLSIIGQRIAEAVNTLCADSAPVTCKPSDCNVLDETTGTYTDQAREKTSPACTCQFGCNTKTYLANTAYEYHLCNEFDFKVSTVKENENGDFDLSTLTTKTVNEDYTIDYESTYCSTRTGSPIQVKLIKTESGKNVVFEYPKKVSGVY